MVCIDSILSRYPHPTTTIIIEIGSDYSNILDSLRISIPIISMNKHLHQVIREIHLIKTRWSIRIKLNKIIAHQDNRKAISELTWYKLLNVKCNMIAKRLIQFEERQCVPFPFKLASPYLISRESKLVLNSKESLYLAI